MTLNAEYELHDLPFNAPAGSTVITKRSVDGVVWEAGIVFKSECDGGKEGLIFSVISIPSGQIYDCGRGGQKLVFYDRNTHERVTETILWSGGEYLRAASLMMPT